MFQNAALDIAIGLALMYLMLSLTCTVINEYIATKLNLRARSLATGLQELLDDPAVRTAFYNHGLVAGTGNALTKARELPMVEDSAAAPPSGSPPPPSGPPRAVTHPAYLSTETFVLALVGSLTASRVAAGRPIPGFADVQAAIQDLPPSRIKDALVTSLIVAQGDFDQFRKNLARWFDDSMDRLSGAYRRHLKFISIIVGCLMAIILNADTFEVGHALWSDGALRSQMVQVADATSRTERPTQSTSGQFQQPAGTEAGTSSSVDAITEAFKKADDQLRPLPIGWPLKPDARSIRSWLVRMAGWFVTGLALSLGAPFWFDTLSKFMNMRSTGVKPQRQS
jgi:hypothetical protein